MGWTIFKRIPLGRGVNLNLSRRGLGASWGVPGFRFGIGAGGRRYVSIGIPGTGIRYFQDFGRAAAKAVPDRKR